MTGVYTQYFQKSKVFLYPLLDLQKGIDYVPEQTYIAWDKLYHPSDLKFLCLYTAKKTDKKFIDFQNKHLKFHPLVETYLELDNDTHIYIFDYSSFRHDHRSFVKGEYSKLKKDTKTTILNFFGSVGNIATYVKSFLDPEAYHEEYAEALGVELSIIESVWELCSSPDLKKETLFNKVPEELEIFKNISISLDKI
jgi:hypothetical protein